MTNRLDAARAGLHRFLILIGALKELTLSLKKVARLNSMLILTYTGGITGQNLVSGAFTRIIGTSVDVVPQVNLARCLFQFV